MKKSMFILMFAAAAMLGSLFSCTKDDSGLPEVIESEVLESGIEKNVTATTGTDGSIFLAYESWILVRQQTRSGDNRFTVQVNGQLNNHYQKIEVGSFESGRMRTVTEYEEDGRRREGYLTIIDSALVYTVAYDNFSFAYRLKYEVPVYDDGVTCQTMPYYRYEGIVDKGGDFQELPSGKNEDGDICAYRLYTHSLSLLFNGVRYDVTAEIMLEKILSRNGEPCVVSSRILNYGLTPVEKGIAYSWVEVEQTWSTGDVKTEKFGIDVTGYMSVTPEMYKILPDANIKRTGAELRTIESFIVSAEGKYVEKKRISQIYEISYNYFTLGYDIVCEEACYDDGVTHFVMPGLAVATIKEEPFAVSVIGETTVAGGLPCAEYAFVQRVQAGIGSDNFTAAQVLSFYVLK